MDIASALVATLKADDVIIPSDTQRAAIESMQRVVARIACDGSEAVMIDEMASIREREAVVDTAGFIARDQRAAS